MEKKRKPKKQTQEASQFSQVATEKQNELKEKQGCLTVQQLTKNEMKTEDSNTVKSPFDALSLPIIEVEKLAAFTLPNVNIKSPSAESNLFVTASAEKSESQYKQRKTLKPYKNKVLVEYEPSEILAELESLGEIEKVTSKTHKIVEPQLGHVYTIKIEQCTTKNMEDAAKIDGLAWKMKNNNYTKPIVTYFYDSLEPSMNSKLKKTLYLYKPTKTLVIHYTGDYQTANVEEEQKGGKDKVCDNANDKPKILETHGNDLSALIEKEPKKSAVDVEDTANQEEKALKSGEVEKDEEPIELFASRVGTRALASFDQPDNLGPKVSSSSSNKANIEINLNASMPIKKGDLTSPQTETNVQDDLGQIPHKTKSDGLEEEKTKSVLAEKKQPLSRKKKDEHLTLDTENAPKFSLRNKYGSEEPSTIEKKRIKNMQEREAAFKKIFPEKAARKKRITKKNITIAKPKMADPDYSANSEESSDDSPPDNGSDIKKGRISTRSRKKILKEKKTTESDSEIQKGNKKFNPPLKGNQNPSFNVLSRIIKTGYDNGKQLLTAQPISDFPSEDDLQVLTILDDTSKQPVNTLPCLFKPKETGEVYIIKNIDFNLFTESEVVRLLNQADEKRMGNDGSKTLKSQSGVIKKAFIGYEPNGQKLARVYFKKYIYVYPEGSSCLVQYVGNPSLIINKDHTFKKSKLRAKTATPKREKTKEEENADAAESKKDVELFKATLDLYNNKIWKSTLPKIFKTDIIETKPVIIKNDPKTLIEAIPAQKLGKTQKICYGQANLIIQRAVSKNAFLDDSETVIVNPEGGYIFLMNCKNKFKVADNYNWRLKGTAYPWKYPFQFKKYQVIDKNNLPSADFERFIFYNSETKNLLIHYCGDETVAFQQQNNNPKQWTGADSPSSEQDNDCSIIAETQGTSGKRENRPSSVVQEKARNANNENLDDFEVIFDYLKQTNTQNKAYIQSSQFNLPYFMNVLVTKKMPLQKTKIPVHTLDDIFDKIPMEKLRLFVNHGSIFEYKAKSSDKIQKFALYSPRIGTCVILTEEGTQISLDILNHAARSVKDGAIRKSVDATELTRIAKVFHQNKWKNTEEETLESKVQEYMSTVPEERVSQKDADRNKVKIVFFTCYCNELLKQDIGMFVECKRCCTKYHNKCLTKEEASSTEHFICVPCSPKPEIVWSHNMESCSNTCPLDNFLQAATLHFMEHPHILEKLDGSNPENILIKTCIEHIQQRQYGSAQEEWINHMINDPSLRNCLSERTETDPNNLYGSSIDISFKPIKSGGTYSQKTYCNNEKCTQNIKACDLSIFEMYSNKSVDLDSDPDKIIENIVNGDGDVPLSDLPKCTSCKTGALGKMPLRMSDARQQWYITFGGSPMGTLPMDDSQKLMQLPGINIEGYTFEPRLIVLHKNANHFISLIKYKKRWISYDDMGEQKKFYPVTPADYEAHQFSYVTYFKTMSPNESP